MVVRECLLSGQRFIDYHFPLLAWDEDSGVLNECEHRQQRTASVSQLPCQLSYIHFLMTFLIDSLGNCGYHTSLRQSFFLLSRQQHFSSLQGKHKHIFMVGIISTRDCNFYY